MLRRRFHARRRLRRRYRDGGRSPGRRDRRCSMRTVVDVAASGCRRARMSSTVVGRVRPERRAAEQRRAELPARLTVAGRIGHEAAPSPSFVNFAAAVARAAAVTAAYQGCTAGGDSTRRGYSRWARNAGRCGSARSRVGAAVCGHRPLRANSSPSLSNVDADDGYAAIGAGAGRFRNFLRRPAPPPATA